jgi:hypothetical protein
MKPGDRMWIVLSDFALAQVDIVLLQQTYAAIGVVVGTGERIPHAHKRFQPTRRLALEAALEDARRRARKADAELGFVVSERAAATAASKVLAEMVLAELEGEVAA